MFPDDHHVYELPALRPTVILNALPPGRWAFRQLAHNTMAAQRFFGAGKDMVAIHDVGDSFVAVKN